LHAGQSGQSVVVDQLKVGEVAGDDAEEVIGIPEEPLRLNDVGDGNDGLLERSDGVPVGAAHGHEDQCLESQAQGVGVEVRMVAVDHPVTFQGAEPAVAG